VIDAFKAANPGAAVDGEATGNFADYWPRLATQVGGGNAPDLIQMDYRYLAEYASRGVLEPLDGYLGKVLNLADFPKPALESCSVSGKLYGVNLGTGSHALIFDRAAFESAGAAIPDFTTSWEEFFASAAQVTKANAGKYFGTHDAGWVETAFENWLRQRGKALYTAEGALGMTADDVGDWYAMWQSARDMQACPPADIAGLEQAGPDESLLSQGRAAASFNQSNTFAGFQAVNQKKLSLTSYPQTDGGPNGNYLKPTMMWSLYSGSSNKEAALRFADFWVNSSEAAVALGLDRGVPVSPKAQEAVSASLDEVGKLGIEYVRQVGTVAGNLPPTPPKGAGEIQTLLRTFNEQVGFGQLDAAAAGKGYVTEAAAILQRSQG
jgi:multiple sugar transport system substrate-binding protein